MWCMSYCLCYGRTEVCTRMTLMSRRRCITSKRLQRGQSRQYRISQPPSTALCAHRSTRACDVCLLSPIIIIAEIHEECMTSQRTQKAAVLCGIVAVVAFLALYVIAMSLDSTYVFGKNYLSDLGVSNGAWAF